MRYILYLLLVLSIAGCGKEEEALPCLSAEVVGPADCGEGTVIRVYGDNTQQQSVTNGCTFVSEKKYIVDNLPENLKAPGTTFTCQLAEPEKNQEGQICQAVYVVYEAATIKRLCSTPEPAL